VKEDAEGYSKEEIKPLFEDTPVLRGLISESKSRGTASNTILLKQLGNGGLIDIVNAASGRSFRRKSRKVVLFDEVDAYPKLDEGDPIKLGRNRADYYWDRKIGMGGTPIFVGGKTEEAFLRGKPAANFFVAGQPATCSAVPSAIMQQPSAGLVHGVRVSVVLLNPNRPRNRFHNEHSAISRAALCRSAAPHLALRHPLVTTDLFDSLSGQHCTRRHQPVRVWNPGWRCAHHRRSLREMEAGIRLPYRLQRE
jgi:hypothetical protein